MKKTFDAVAVMRKAREELACKWADKPREEQIEALRKKHPTARKGKRASRQ
jgi:hypothetical protein